ncbi:GreA/GreB family elongation factor [Prevotella sp. E13-17]|uniref:GreA/GreB family elongation factor n=1 Tax=Prevotella sp. E13-17 TaxID=2913616 RepID=UPI00351D4968
MSYLCQRITKNGVANLREGKISIKSPIAQALLNKKVGDIVEVRVPAGIQRLRIESISL